MEDSFSVLDSTDQQTEEYADLRSDYEHLEVNIPGSSITVSTDNRDKNTISGGELSAIPDFRAQQILMTTFVEQPLAKPVGLLKTP